MKFIMKVLKVALAMFAVSVFAHAQAPESLVGYLYDEIGSLAGPFPQRAQEHFAATFAADGTFAQIFFMSSPGAGAPTRLGEPRSGAFSYRRIDAMTAEFSLGGVQTGRLQFDSATAHTGTFVDPNRAPSDFSGVVARRFRLVSQAQYMSLINCSNRSFVRAGGKAYTGFVVGGIPGSPDFRTVLIRAVGPGLAPFGIEERLRDPALVVSSAGPRTNDNWESENAESIRRTTAAVGAFPLASGSTDAALLRRIPVGAHVVEVSSTQATDAGEVMIEVYILP